jgi:REP element-mobilizing transposase RayT
MPKARNAQISLLNTPYYHCVSRCVRRAFLCGKDKYSGQSYEHRRQWVEKRIHKLSCVFAIDVCAYAVMSNHTHLVLHIHRQKALDFSSHEVIRRWHMLHKGTLLTQQAMHNQPLSEAQTDTLNATVEVWRQRLYDISWFMRLLNEYIARLANKEDSCTGRFWEGRFKSQALLGEAALAACMAYVDLNPIRANMAKTPETSNHTSIQYRINAAKAGKTPKYLLRFAGNAKQNRPFGLPFTLPDYLELVDSTGKRSVNQKKREIDNTLPSLLCRLNIAAEQWDELTTTFEECFQHAAGNEKELLRYQVNQKLQRLRNKGIARRLFG